MKNSQGPLYFAQTESKQEFCRSLQDIFILPNYAIKVLNETIQAMKPMASFILKVERATA